MMKLNGKQVEVSLLKCWLSDVTFNQLEETRDYLELDSNVITLTYIIDGYYKLMKQWKDNLEKDKELVTPGVTTPTFTDNNYPESTL